ncbi:vitamin B12 dependent-methionine synthase activation domain-containing protein [uncultured Bacteroides sp.]|uniref:vitamin B12 dependent-methionine synthase activation domain-containing protein n=1 Tax=uncultured Bacteroides sp. TaxID=162156 RepID=UPI002AAB12EF|nr:vitamin B12 dependent-methionine synthase activation domain-containing protein [uncultured Bacteroides sp.]
MVKAYKIHELVEYIDWLYFFHAWRLGAHFGQISEIHGCDSCRAQWLTSFPEEERPKAAEAMQLYKEANRMLNELDKDFEVKVMYELFDSNSDGDNLFVGNVVIPMLRQQTRKKDNEPYLCLSDFVRPLSSEQKDTIGVFASSVDPDMERIYENDPYKHILVQTLTDRLAEAAVEKMHEYIRKVAWGYAKDENLTIKEMLKVKYQGIRPAVGYPSIPDQSINFLLNELIDMSKIGIKLTENGAMYPHASVSGIMISHPASSYFSIGKIGEDQLNDYAQRRGMDVSVMRKFLAANL